MGKVKELMSKVLGNCLEVTTQAIEESSQRTPVVNESTQLQGMLDTQRKLQERLKSLPDMDKPKSRTAYIKEMSIHVNQEMNEMLYELPWFKPWSQKYKDWNDYKVNSQYQKAREEFIDVFTFLLNIGLALGFDAEMWEKMYYAKNKINHKRQDGNY